MQLHQVPSAPLITSSANLRLLHDFFLVCPLILSRSHTFCLFYRRLYSKNYCIACGKFINSEELVMRTSDSVFHLQCFSCVVCGVQLQKGEQYVIKQSQLFCRMDYIKEVEMLQGYHGKCQDSRARESPI